ncbi:MAG: zinc-binding dehydrogenase [Gemmatimonadota bacterium]
MRAAIFSEHGGPEVLRIADVDVPEPGPGEVRIRVRASALNHLDLWVRRGLPIETTMPHIGGSDIAGRVEAVGPGVEGVPEGTRVVVDPVLGWEWVEGVERGEDFPAPRFRLIGEHTQGGFAEYAVVPAANLLQVPDEVSFETAAAAGLVFVTAWRALVTRGGVRAGESVLVTGGSGGVATAAIQIAARSGARVCVLTSGKENAERVRELGAEVVLDRTEGSIAEVLEDGLGKATIDLALDSVGEPAWDGLIRVLKVRGRLVSIGATAGPKPGIDLRHVFWKQLSILGSTMGSPAEFRQVMRLVFRGAFRPVVDAILPLEQVEEAHRRLEAGDVFGKLVLLPDTS